jgi:DivIVA domain-containing protein
VSDPRELARSISEVRFRPTRGDAYDMADVDAFMDTLEAAAKAGQPLGGLVAGKQLRTVSRRQGYGRQDVDSFLAHVAAGGELSAGPREESVAVDPQVAALEDVRFTPVRLREGYDLAEVDRLLDHLVAGVLAGEPLGPIVAAARLGRTRLRVGYDVGQVDEFLRQQTGEPGRS